MKVKLNPMFEEASGQLGELVFREVNGVTIAGRKPSFTGDPSVGQIAQRERFKQAVAYGKSVMANESVRARYEEAAKNKNIPVFALTIADFFNEPTIQRVDLSAYHGVAGDPIYIYASDDLGVMQVSILITGNANSVLEGGQAVEEIAGSGLWKYETRSGFSEGDQVNLTVTATDRPGGTASVTQSIAF